MMHNQIASKEYYKFCENQCHMYTLMINIAILLFLKNNNYNQVSAVDVY